MPNAARQPARAHHGRRRALLVVGLLVLAGGIAGAAAVARRLSRTAPDWWRQVDADNEQTVRRAEAFENAFAKEMTRVRPRAEAAPAATDAGAATVEGAGDADPEPQGLVSEPWSVAIAAEPANAWLNTKMQDWAVSWSDEDNFEAWPPEIEQIQVGFREGLMDVGIRYRYSRRDPTKTRVLTMAVKPWIDEEGSLWFEADSVGFGQLRLPPGLFLSDDQLKRLPRHVRELPEAQRLLRTLMGQRPATWKPLVELPDGREVRLLGVRVLDGRLELTCRTEAEVSSAAR